MGQQVGTNIIDTTWQRRLRQTAARFVVAASATLAFGALLPGSLSVGGAEAVTPTATPTIAPCGRAVPAATYGQVTATVSIPTAGTYKAWSRIQAPTAANNSYYLEIYSCGGTASTTQVGSWVWVSSGTIGLPAGSQSVKMVGTKPDVKLDRVIFTTDQTCVPTGLGDNCATTATPTPTVTITPTRTPTPTPTPTPTQAPKPGDLNADGKVNVFDLSNLLSKWGTNAAGADINRDGTVNVFDLSIILSNWTG